MNIKIHKIMISITNLRICRLLPDRIFIKLRYFGYNGYFPNLSNPTTFNEKLQWLKLHDHNPKYTTMVDKYAVKEYIATHIGEQYVIPTLGVWERFDDIDFASLPDKFVLKCTHDSGGLVICKDKSSLNIKAAKKKLNKSLRKNYYYVGREWPYKNVKPRIIAEKYMEDRMTSELRDYKFFCFNGIPKCYTIHCDRFNGHRANCFDLDSNLLKIGYRVAPPDFDRNIQKPKNLQLMQELAKKLSVNTSFLRIDFYEVNERVYFGELTFYSGSGFSPFIFDGNDELIGSWLKLPESYRDTV